MGLRATHSGSQILGIRGTISFDIQNVPAAGPPKMTPKPARMAPIHPNVLITFETLTLFLLSSSGILWNMGSFWAGASHQWEMSLWASSAPSSLPDRVWKSTCPGTNPNISSPNFSRKASCSLCSDCFRKKNVMNHRDPIPWHLLVLRKYFSESVWQVSSTQERDRHKNEEKKRSWWQTLIRSVTSPGYKVCSADSHVG